MRINRKELVRRHNPTIQSFDPSTPLSVGNGEFAYTADFTGVQTFCKEHRSAVPLCTMSQWGWHTTPVSRERWGYHLSDLELEPYDTAGRLVGYPRAVRDKRASTAG